MKTILLFTVLTLYCLTSLPFYLSKSTRYIICPKIVSFYSSLVLKILDITVNIKGEKIPKKTLIVSNHLSYIDILVLSKIVSCNFITSNEVKESFFLGLLSKLGGTFFVDRINPSNIHKEIEEISNHFKCVCLFPEATSSDGSKILPFKSSLFAMAKNELVTPIYLKYSDPNLICYYGQHKFFPHLKNLINYNYNIETEVIVSRPISNDNRKQLCSMSYEILNTIHNSI